MIKSTEQLIGKNKKEIVKILGDQMNVPFGTTWNYTFRKNIFQNRHLVLHFDKDSFLYKVEERKSVSLRKIFVSAD